MLDLSLQSRLASRDQAGGDVILHYSKTEGLQLRLVEKGARVEPDAGLDDALAGIIARELAKTSPAWSGKLPEERALWSRAVVQTVPSQRRTATHAHIEHLRQKTAELASSYATRGSLNDVLQGVLQSVRADWWSGDNPRMAAVFDLERRLPVLEATTLLEVQVTSDGPQGPAARAVRAVDMLMNIFIKAQGPDKAGINQGLAVLQANPVAQQALLERCIQRLESWVGTSAPATERDQELSRMLSGLADVVEVAAFRSIFTNAAVISLLGASKTLELVNPDLQTAYKTRLKILQRNQKRYQRFLDSRWGQVPSLDRVSRGFRLEMYERVEGLHDASKTSTREVLLDYTLRPESFPRADKDALPLPAGLPPRQRENPYTWALALADRLSPVASAWDLQVLLTELNDPDDEAEALLWQHATDCLQLMSGAQARDVLADAHVIDGLKRYVHSHLGEHSYPARQLLPVLQTNARRMEAFMRSDVARNPTFDEVDRVLLVPWWEATQGHLADDPRDVQAPLVAQASVTVPDASSTVAPAETPLDAPPGNDEPREQETAPPASATPAATPVPVVIHAREPALTRQLNPQVPLAAAHRPAPAETKSTPPGDLPAAGPARSYPPLRPSQMLASADPLRTDVPTGQEARNAAKRRGHHDPRRMKWLSRGEVKRRLEEIREQVQARHDLQRRRGDGNQGRLATNVRMS